MGLNLWTIAGITALGIGAWFLYDGLVRDKIKTIIATKEMLRGDTFALRHSLKDKAADWIGYPDKEFFGLQNEQQSLTNTFGNSFSVYDDVF